MANTSIVPLPKQAIDEDHRLEKAASGASLALMKHRWHWTLDESNEKRVSVSQYARDVEKGNSTIRSYAHAYELALSGERTPGEALERARMSAEKHEAVEAVAKARAVGVAAVRQNPRYRDEVRQVRATARERAEEKGTSTREEAKKAAEWAVKIDQAQKREKEQKRARHGWQYLKAEGKLDDAKRKMVEAIEAMLGVEFDNEERDLLLHTIREVQESAELARAAVAGRSTGAWTKKFEVLRGGRSA